MAELTKAEAQEEIKNLVDSAYASIKLAEALAQEHKLDFDFSVAYGMGGTYYGDASKIDSWHGRSQPGWVSSSEEC